MNTTEEQLDRPTLDQAKVLDKMFAQIFDIECEICHTLTSAKTYDENLGVCDACNRRLE